MFPSFLYVGAIGISSPLTVVPLNMTLSYMSRQAIACVEPSSFEMYMLVMFASLVTSKSKVVTSLLVSPKPSVIANSFIVFILSEEELNVIFPDLK